MSDQDTHTIESVKQSMLSHIYDLNTVLSLARAATEGLLPQPYNDKEDAIRLMIGQAYSFPDKLLNDLENMDVADGSVESSTEVPVINSVCRKAREDLNTQRLQLFKAKSVLDLMYASTEADFDNFDDAAGAVAGIVGSVIKRLDEIETGLGVQS